LRLDRLFAPRDPEVLVKTPGIFLFKGDVRMADVANLYELAVSEDLRDLTLSEAFAERFESRLEVGDTIQLGPATLAALETDGDLLISAVLEVDDLDGELMSSDHGLTGRRAAPSTIFRLAGR
jgi:hypothetical protein